MDLDREAQVVRAWYEIASPEELVEAVLNIRSKKDLGPLGANGADVIKRRLRAFQRNHKISEDQAQDLMARLDKVLNNTSQKTPSSLPLRTRPLESVRSFEN
jgi:hypothetical protein